MKNEIDIARIDEDDDYRQELRWRAQTDLLWLAKFMLGYTLIDEEDHAEVANMFVKKDPRKPLEEQDTKHKVRIILMPRRTYKTTFNIADGVQWILCFPEVAIMAMTASNSPDSPLADAFVMETAMHFYHAEGTPLRPLHLCFPEHVIHKLPKAGEFTTPARQNYRRDPTLKGVSIEQSLSGWHPDILKAEDIQDNRNSQTSFGLNKVWKNLNVNIKMLADWGYRDHTGTRYGPGDVYGRMLSRPNARTKTLWKPAYSKRKHALELDDDDLNEGDVILFFPRLLPWEFLRSVKADDPDSFWTQYMNVAEGNFKPTFPIERLHNAKVEDEHSPEEDKATIAWRFEYAEMKNAAGAVGIERNGRMIIVEVIRGQFTPTALALRVVRSAKKWETHRIEIEDTPGARASVPAIRNAALEEDWHLEISWSEFLQDDTARSMAIKSAEPHLLAGRLLFSDGLANGDEAFRQLYQFGMVEEFEVASVIARVVNKLPSSIAAEGFEVQDEEAFKAYIEEDAYNRTYGRGKYNTPEPVFEEEEEWQPGAEGAEFDDMMPGLTG